MPNKIEVIVGNVFAAIIIAVMIFSFFATLFGFFFRDGRTGVGLYGNRGDSYMYDDYQPSY